MKVIFSILVLNVLTTSSLLNLELLFSLRDYFSSDAILLASKGNKVELAKKLFKYKNASPKAFLGFIDLERNADDFIPPSQISKFQNIIIASDCGEEFILKLIELQVVLPHLMASLVFVIFAENDVAAQLKNLYIPFNYKFLLVNKNLEILDVYQVGINDTKIYSTFSNWGIYEKFDFPIENFYARRMDLRGAVIHMMYTPEQDYTQYWKLFAEIMNFTLGWVPVVYGGIFPNGTKYGLIKMLDESEIDGTHHNYKFTHERADIFDYIFPAFIAETKIYVAYNEEVNWTLYYSPFSTGVWISILVWIIIASSIMIVLNEFNSGNNSESYFFNVIRATCYQSGTINNLNISFYITYFMCYILGFFIVQAYSSVLFSYLTVKKLTLPFENLKEIMQIGSHKILLENDSYTLYFWKTDVEKESIFIRNNLLVPESEMIEWEDKKTGFQLICQKNLIFITGTSDYTIDGECSIGDLKEILFLDVEGILVRKTFPYTSVLNELMKKIQFVGLEKLKRKNTIAPNESSHHFKPLPFISVISIFIFLIFSIIFSVLIFLCERNLSEKLNR